MQNSKYRGYHAVDFETPYAKFYDETIVPPPAYVEEAKALSPLPTGALPPVEEARLLQQKGYAEFESGYTLESNGSARIAVLTTMPGVSPEMWDWWFGWHGSMDNRYKLWHPKAHLSAAWEDGNQQEMGYIGRTSVIQEYVGNTLVKGNIRFVSPAEMGFDLQQLADKNQEVIFCARLGFTQFPIDLGWLVHQVRAVEGGAEMRSRFWMGGPHIGLRSTSGIAKLGSQILQKTVSLPKGQTPDLLHHCSEEMSHLAAFLPALYAEFYPF
jgi:hypothetical protein